MGEIYLVRHGQASFGADDYDQLSDRGHEQGRILGRWHAALGVTVDGVALGNMKRHRQTAEAWATEVPNAPAPTTWTIDPGFDEYDHREMLLRAHPEAADAAGLKRWLAASAPSRQVFQEIFEAAMARWMSGRHDGDYRESWPQFLGRCTGALDTLVARAGASKRLMVFTSGGTISAICQSPARSAADARRRTQLVAGEWRRHQTVLPRQPAQPQHAQQLQPPRTGRRLRPRDLSLTETTS